MGNPQFSELTLQIKHADRIGAEDVLRLRRVVYGGSHVTKSQIDALFDLDRECAEKSAEWSDFFAETAAVYLVEQQEPYGYVDESNADWLIAHISRDGRIDTATELELLVKVLEKSKKSPGRLVRFGLEAVRETVLNGDGPARRGGAYKPAVVTEADVELLRRILYAYGGDNHIAVTRTEADVLFDINDATVEAENHPAWSDLFTKAIASCLLGYSGYLVPTRREALRRGRWLDEPVNFPAFLSRMVGGLGDVFAIYGSPKQRPSKQPSSWRNAEVDEARRVTKDEATWLASRLNRDGRLHENEIDLLRFLDEKAADIDPTLKPVVASALTSAART